MGSRLWEHSCSRLGTARRCEPPPAPRVPTLGARGAQHPTPAGVPGAARKNTCCWLTWGQPGPQGTQREQLGKPSEDTSSLEKNIWDGGGSHRRSRAASTAALMDVATETPLTPAPRAGEVFTGGRTVAPCPVQTGQWVIGHTQQLPGWRGVLGVALG